MRLTLCIAALTVLLVQPAFAQKPNDATNCAGSSPDIAIPACTAVIGNSKATRQERVSAYTSRGTAWYVKKDYDRALADFDEAINLDPKSVQARITRGSVWYIKGDLDRAFADCERAIQIDAKYGPAYSCRAGVWRERGNLDRSLADYDIAVSLTPNYPFARYGRGLTKLRKGDAAGSSADFAAAKAIRADVAALYPKFGRPQAAPVPAPARLNADAESNSAPAADCAGADLHWKSVETMGVLAAYEDHLTRFPTCAYATLAKIKIEALKKQ